MLFEDATHQKLSWLESEGLQFLTDKEQAFVVGCKTALDMGTPLPKTALDSVDELFKKVRQSSSSAHTGLDAPLSMAKVLGDLSKATAMLHAEELKFYKKMLAKLQARKTFSTEETLALLRIYSSKGF